MVSDLNQVLFSISFATPRGTALLLKLGETYHEF